MGSTSDWEVMAGAADTRDALGIPTGRRVVRGHGAPARVVE